MGMVSEKARVFSIAPHSAQKIALHLLLISKKTYGMILMRPYRLHNKYLYGKRLG